MPRARSGASGGPATSRRRGSRYNRRCAGAAETSPSRPPQAIALAEALGTDLDIVAGIDRLEELGLLVSSQVAVGTIRTDAELRGAIGEEPEDGGGRDEAVRIVGVVQPEPEAQITLGFF